MGLFETMKYKVIRKIGRIEIREYDDFLLASTKSKLNEKQDSGFMNLFNYISGDNENNKKISMTTPVVTYREDNDLVTGFYVGSKYQEDNLPKPKDNVFINKLNNSLYGVIRFSGRWIDKNFDKYDDLLVNYLLKENYDILSARFILRYQPPFVPWFLRRNEIAYQVRRKNEKPNN
jgi:hypothetical protein